MTEPRFQLVPGGRLVHEPGVDGVGWRLLGSNNRELGRSTVSYRDAEAALAAIEHLRSLVDSGTAHVEHDARSSTWVWMLTDGQRAVAGSGRGFRLERECRYNFEQFRAAAPTAPSGSVLHALPWQQHPDAVPADMGGAP